MKPLRLAKATALSFALGAILSAASSPAIIHQAEAMALSQAQAIATSAMRSLSSWLEQGLDAALKGLAKQFTQSG